MDRAPIRGLLISIFLIFPMANSEAENVKQALLKFIEILAAGNPPTDPSWGWNNASDPCNGPSNGTWKGLTCKSQRVSKLVLEGLNFIGKIDSSSLCTSSSLAVLSLKGNKIIGTLSEDIGNCRSLTHLYLNGNQFSGGIPVSLSRLVNLKKLDISDNEFSGEIPDLFRISGLLVFLVQNNQLNGSIPHLDFSNLEEFNVSNNNLSGPVPDFKGKFPADSFVGNVELCGAPLSNACPPSAPALAAPPALAPPPNLPSKEEGKRSLKHPFLVYLAYIIVLAIVLILVALKLVSKSRQRERNIDAAKKTTSAENDSKSSTRGRRSEYSITSAESGRTSTSLVILSNPVVKDLKFEDLLRASAELLGRGKHGSLYKVRLDNGVILVVKRIKDWGISAEDFMRRMRRIDSVKHTRVLPVVALYCSKEEKLLVYEYQRNGSLFNLLHGSESGQLFDWASRLSVALNIAEALASMHKELRDDGIAHGNLKSTNVLFNNSMEPSISEYGLMIYARQDQSDNFKQNVLNGDSAYSTFKVDVYSLGVILLELLTGKLMQNNDFDLARWVHSVVREEWTVEVFDRTLISQGASEERMVNLLQVALQCINPSPNERPSISQVAAMINTIKVDEDRSMSSEACFASTRNEKA